MTRGTWGLSSGVPQVLFLCVSGSSFFIHQQSGLLSPVAQIERSSEKAFISWCINDSPWVSQDSNDMRHLKRTKMRLTKPKEPSSIFSPVSGWWSYEGACGPQGWDRPRDHAAYNLGSLLSSQRGHTWLLPQHLPLWCTGYHQRTRLPLLKEPASTGAFSALASEAL